MIDMVPEIAAGGLGTINLIALFMGYGKLQAVLGRVVEDVSKLDRAIHNGMSTHIIEIREDVAGIKATCHERASRESCG